MGMFNLIGLESINGKKENLILTENFTMCTKEIKRLKSLKFSDDTIYQIAAGELGLFHVAFYGHKGTRNDRSKLNRTWNRILKTA